MLEFIEVNAKDNNLIEELSRVASEIVKSHYDPIIGSDQNDYMIAKFQSVDGLKEQITNGSRCFLVRDNGKDAGYFSFYPKGNKMYLSKYYLYSQERGKGYGRAILEFVKAEGKKLGLQSLFLNVNKYNGDSIGIYQHFGFKQIREERNDIGNGYYMDDYVLECDID